MELIVPAAGRSTRFPNTIPKYLLTDTNNKLMITNAILPYLDQCNITIGILWEHRYLHDAINKIRNQLGSAVNILELPDITNGPASTVYQIAQTVNLSVNSPVLIKDCDSYFKHDITDGNYVCVSNVMDHTVLYNISNKSFVMTNEHNIVQTIIEKSIISNAFCVGGYKFNKLSEFNSGYNALINSMKTEFFISHVIQYNISKGDIFLIKNVTDYVDVGTLEQWQKHTTSTI
jgi:2-C-methyl-D-erythritol 4-phosphate cytidylyltransferase